MADKKIKILTLGDMPLLPSGVGTQTKYMIEALLNTGKFKVVSLGGAIDHPDFTPIKVEPYGDDWIIFPVKGYGDANLVRGMLATQKPDMVWFMTDPRFYEWLWHIDNEVRQKVPLVYYHVWDNYPYPYFNQKFYNSNDYIATISKVTSDIVQTVSPNVEEKYIPHAVDCEIFRKLNRTPEETSLIKNLKQHNSQDKFVFFWNNRNARRKQPGTLMFWFKEFLDIVGHDKAMLVMHTDLKDPHGQPLDYISESLGCTNGQFMFSVNKMPPEELARLYNIADCTINIADAEGFGLATLESLSCETPIIVNMTGGLQEQVTDGENWFGIGIEPSSASVIGSQQVAYIREDRINKQEFIDALLKVYNMSHEERRELGKAGRKHVMTNYNFEDFKKTWVEQMLHIHEKYGSWETRKNYKRWECKEIT